MKNEKAQLPASSDGRTKNASTRRGTCVRRPRSDDETSRRHRAETRACAPCRCRAAVPPNEPPAAARPDARRSSCAPTRPCDDVPPLARSSPSLRARAATRREDRTRASTESARCTPRPQSISPRSSRTSSPRIDFVWGASTRARSVTSVVGSTSVRESSIAARKVHAGSARWGCGCIGRRTSLSRVERDGATVGAHSTTCEGSPSRRARAPSGGRTTSRARRVGRAANRGPRR